MASAKPSRSDLAFASVAVYCPRGDSPAIVRSRDLMLQVKENRVIGSETTAARVARRIRELALTFADEYLGPTVTLVPVPRSGLQSPGALWPAWEIATALHRAGFGTSVLPCLERVRAVPKAATSARTARPKARTHFESLHVRDPITVPARVTLIDDVVTRGAQLFGAAWRLSAGRPNIEVRAFAIIRTLSDPDEFTAIGAPVTGSIEWRNEECRRRP